MEKEMMVEWNWSGRSVESTEGLEIEARSRTTARTPPQIKNMLVVAGDSARAQKRQRAEARSQQEQHARQDHAAQRRNHEASM